jgi:hypothetical protein
VSAEQPPAQRTVLRLIFQAGNDSAGGARSGKYASGGVNGCILKSNLFAASRPT